MLNNMKHFAPLPLPRGLLLVAVPVKIEIKISDSENPIFDVLDGIIFSGFSLQWCLRNRVRFDRTNFVNGFSFSEVRIDNHFHVLTGVL